MSNAPNEEDAALVARCLRGESAAWAALVQRYQRLVYAIVLRIGLDEHGAADVFQTVFTRLILHLPRIADPQSLKGWIVTTAKREALLQRKLGKRNVSTTIADDATEDDADWDFADTSPIAEQALDDLQQQVMVRDGLDRLDARCRDLLLLIFCDEDDKLSYEEVARRLGISVGSIGPTRARCLDKLRALVT